MCSACEEPEQFELSESDDRRREILEMRASLFAAGVFICFSAGAAHAGIPGIEWTRTMGGTGADEGYSVRQTADGGYVVTGVTVSFGAGEADVYLVRTDSEGDTLWTRTFGGSSNDWGECVSQTADGGFIITGITASFGSGGRDIYLVKTDDSGSTEWTATYGGSEDDEGYAVQQTSDGGYVIVGSTCSFGAGEEDLFLIKTDSSGDTLWTGTFGGAETDFGAFVQQTADGGYIIAGATGSTGAGMNDAFLLKTDPYGNTLWSATFGGSEADVAYYVQQTADGGCIAAGYTSSFGSGGNDVYLIRTDSDGNALWTKTFGGSGNDTGESVQQTDDGGFIIAGFTNSFGAGGMDVYAIRTDADVDTLWTGTAGGTGYDRCNSVIQTTDGGFILGGLTLSFGAGSSDVYLVKLGAETGIEELTVSSQIALEDTRPNPFASALSITFSITEQTGVELSVLDISGRLVETLVSGQLSPGIHTAEWVPSPDIPSGCYLVRLDACGCSESVQCIRLN